MERKLERATCCNGVVVKVETASGKQMPLNPDPDPLGLFVFTGPGKVRALKKPERGYDETVTGERYTSHHATCEASRRNTRGVTSAARARTQQRFDARTAEMEQVPELPVPVENEEVRS